MDGLLILQSTRGLWSVGGWTVDSAVYKRLVERGWMDC